MRILETPRKRISQASTILSQGEYTCFLLAVLVINVNYFLRQGLLTFRHAYYRETG